MAEEVQIVLWCDPCLAADQPDRVPAKGYELNGLRVDLCDFHGTVVQEALAVAQTYGRKVAKAKVGRPAKPAPTVPEAPPKIRRPNLTDEEKAEIRRRAGAGETQAVLAAAFQVAPSAIGRAVNGRTP